MANKPNERSGSGRVTPRSSATKTPVAKAASAKSPAAAKAAAAKANAAAKTSPKAASSRTTAPAQPASKRYTPPDRTVHAPSPIWVPILMFTLLGLGMLLIILNYAGVLGTAQNWRLVVGLVLILAGILTATQYR